MDVLHDGSRRYVSHAGDHQKKLLEEEMQKVASRLEYAAAAEIQQRIINLQAQPAPASTPMHGIVQNKDPAHVDVILWASVDHKSLRNRIRNGERVLILEASGDLYKVDWRGEAGWAKKHNIHVQTPQAEQTCGVGGGGVRQPLLMDLECMATAVSQRYGAEAKDIHEVLALDFDTQCKHLEEKMQDASKKTCYGLAAVFQLRIADLKAEEALRKAIAAQDAKGILTALEKVESAGIHQKLIGDARAFIAASKPKAAEEALHEAIHKKHYEAMKSALADAQASGVSKDVIDGLISQVFVIGKRVYCRDFHRSWQTGVLTSAFPLKVKPDGPAWRMQSVPEDGFTWDEVMPQAFAGQAGYPTEGDQVPDCMPPVDDGTTVYEVSDHVEVSDPNGQWYKGIVSEVADSMVIVKFLQADCSLKSMMPLRDDSRLLRFRQTAQLGSRVQLHGLSGDDEKFNGKRGVVTACVSNRWFVKLNQPEQKDVDVCHVEAADGSGQSVQPGSRVQLFGMLGDDARFNGKRGLATKRDGNKWSVQLEKDVNAEHLKVFDGKLAITMRCSELQDGWRLEEAWKVQDILADVARKCRIHESCVVLTFRTVRFDLYPDVGLGKLNIKGKHLDAGTVYATPVREEFPEHIGPFPTVQVPMDGKAFSFTDQAPNTDADGTWWRLREDAVEGLGLPSIQEIVCQTSPRSPITLGPEEKIGAGIPVDATYFLWSYQLPQGSSPMDIRNDTLNTFLKLGGFMYLKGWEVLKVTTLLPPKGNTGGLQFEPPRAWNPEWTPYLMNRQGRFQEITVPAMRKAGATHYCWLKPNEKLLDSNGMHCLSQPEARHGAFVYLFHADERDREHGDQWDRYFPIACGVSYKRQFGEPVMQTPGSPSASLLGLSYWNAVNNSAISSLLQVRPLPRPAEWSAEPGLVRLPDGVIPQFQALFRSFPDGTHKETRNWTRDRGCRIHGVGNQECIRTRCIDSNKAPVPKGYKVVEVLRNQNEELWEQYSRQRIVLSDAREKLGAAILDDPIHTQRFTELVGSRVQPMQDLWLFHGTSAAACRGICETNFASDKCGCGDTWKPAPGAGWAYPLYGFGYYLAEDVTKSDEYAKDDGTGIFSMLLCRVCLGRPFVVVDHSLSPADYEREVASGNKNSVIGDRVKGLNKPYREMVLYESEQIYPEFIIKYERRWL